MAITSHLWALLPHLAHLCFALIRIIAQLAGAFHGTAAGSS